MPPKWPGDHSEKHSKAAKLGWARRKRKAAAKNKTYLPGERPPLPVKQQPKTTRSKPYRNKMREELERRLRSGYTPKEKPGLHSRLF